MDQILKPCPKCGSDRDATHSHERSVHPYCRSCTAEYMRKWRRLMKRARACVNINSLAPGPA